MSIENYYTDEFYVDTITSTNESGVIKEELTQGGPFLGKFDPLRAPLEIEYQGKVVKATGKLFCSVNTTIAVNDLVTIGSVVYRVVDLINPFSKGHHLEAILTKDI